MLYEKFYAKNKDNDFLNDLIILKFRAYHYKELAKIFANHFYSQEFQGTRGSLYCLLVMPTFTILAFNLINPFSIFKSIVTFGVFGGSLGSLYFNWKQELADIAKSDAGALGDQIRSRYQEIAIFDGLQMSYREETLRLKAEKER